MNEIQMANNEVNWVAKEGRSCGVMAAHGKFVTKRILVITT